MCRSCPPHKGTLSKASSSCTACLQGTFNIQNTTDCDICPQGTFQPSLFEVPPRSGAAAAYACTPCNDVLAATTTPYQGAHKKEDCSLCQRGYGNFVAGVGCSPCALGTFNGGARTTCQACPAGTTTLGPPGTAIGIGDCSVCTTAGYYYYTGCPSGSAGANCTKCRPCPKGQYSVHGTSCHDCPEDYTTPSAGAGDAASLLSGVQARLRPVPAQRRLRRVPARGVLDGRQRGLIRRHVLALPSRHYHGRHRVDRRFFLHP